MLPARVRSQPPTALFADSCLTSCVLQARPKMEWRRSLPVVPTTFPISSPSLMSGRWEKSRLKRATVENPKTTLAQVSVHWKEHVAGGRGDAFRHRGRPWRPNERYRQGERTEKCTVSEKQLLFRIAQRLATLEEVLTRKARLVGPGKGPSHQNHRVCCRGRRQPLVDRELAEH